MRDPARPLRRQQAHKIWRGLVSEDRDIDVPRGEALPIPLKTHRAVVADDVMYARRHSCVADGAVKIPLRAIPSVLVSGHPRPSFPASADAGLPSRTTLERVELSEKPTQRRTIAQSLDIARIAMRSATTSARSNASTSSCRNHRMTTTPIAPQTGQGEPHKARGFIAPIA